MYLTCLHEKFKCLRPLKFDLLFYGRKQTNYTVGRLGKKVIDIVSMNCEFEVLWIHSGSWFYSVVLMLSFHSHVPIFAIQVQIKTDFYLWAWPSVWDHSFRTFSKFSEKLTFLTYVRVSSGRKCQFFQKFCERTNWIISIVTLTK